MKVVYFWVNMKSSIVSVFLLFASCLFATGLPWRKAEFPGESEESDEVPKNKDVKTSDDVGIKNLNMFRINAANVSCSNASFCEADNQQLPYPSKYVESVLQENASLYAEYFNKISTRDDFSAHVKNLCDTVIEMVYPTIAKDVELDWHFVVNEPQHRQAIQVEKCQNRSSQCHISKSLPLLTDTHRSSCTQKFTKITLLSLNDYGKLTPFMYEFPSHCQCDLHREPKKKRSHLRNA